MTKQSSTRPSPFGPLFPNTRHTPPVSVFLFDFPTQHSAIVARAPEPHSASPRREGPGLSYCGAWRPGPLRVGHCSAEWPRLHPECCGPRGSLTHIAMCHERSSRLRQATSHRSLQLVVLALGALQTPFMFSCNLHVEETVSPTFHRSHFSIVSLLQPICLVAGWFQLSRAFNSVRKMCLSDLFACLL